MKLNNIIIGIGVVIATYEIGKYTGAAISMKQTLCKNPELDKITCRFKNSELTMYQSKNKKAKRH